MKIAFLNPQGNFDSLDSHWTDHPDFGGQLVYVKELAIAMASLGIDVDIITRRIVDEEWPEFSESFDSYPGVGGVRIVRMEFGGLKFLPKEKLWKHLKDYVVEIEKLYEKEGEFPSFVTAHYGDGGIAAAILNFKRDIPFSFTAHSLGAQKMDKLGITLENFHEFDQIYNFSYRIPAERVSMRYSTINFVSTRQERFEQYSHPLYRGWIEVEDDSKFAVVPPGVNTGIFSPVPSELDEEINERYNYTVTSYSTDRLEKPVIISSSRIDPKKNISGLLKAYLSDSELVETANLLIVTRGISNVYSDYNVLRNEASEVLKKLVSLIDEHNARNKVFFMNISNQWELAALYRIASRKGGVFALTSLYEPFGLAPLEAMACGLPVVATRNGGPSEFLKRHGVEYGVLIDPENTASIANGLKRLILDKDFNRELTARISEYVGKYYSWKATARGYLEVIEEKMKHRNEVPEIPEFFLTGGEAPSLF
ncbi:glycosyltransferase [Kosmotoga pacifica]|uniref:sucrose-phosphate synthase n=1 Tax=Kosmotoga pacifica TaxID=1330330 RepID=A0A0G2ZD91_9BACT|nr:glycosyltransferase [Kosmotoga pacifica]AKI97524.1 sucrose-phosphate synthase [Kosmotoga pacifica]